MSFKVRSLIKLTQIKLAEICQDDPDIMYHVPDELIIPILTRIPLIYQREHFDTWATKKSYVDSKYRIEIRREDNYTYAMVFKRADCKLKSRNPYVLKSTMIYFGNKLHGLHEYIRDDNIKVHVYFDNGMALAKATFYADGSFRSRSYYGYKKFALGICEYIKYNPDRTIKTYWYKGNNNETVFHKQILGTYLIKNSTNVKIQKYRLFKQKSGWISCPFWFYANIEIHL